MSDLTLIEFLSKRHGWTKSSTICQALGFHDRRQVAALAEAARGRVISTDDGYRLADNSTPEQIVDAYRFIMRKSKSTGQRANRMIQWARAHGKLGPAHADLETKIGRQIDLELETDAADEKPAAPQSSKEKTGAQIRAEIEADWRARGGTPQPTKPVATPEPQMKLL